MDLCTVVSEKFIPQAINLIKSYKANSYDKKIYVYYFKTQENTLKALTNLFPNQIILKEVPKTCDHSLEPKVFFYKVYAINDCLINRSHSFIYSDSANCFVQKTTDLESDLVDESLFLPYTHIRLSNQYWTTKKCLQKIGAAGAEIMPQYWAGFQVYKRTSDNIDFVSDMLECMKDPDIALPDMSIKRPDGLDNKCIEHRCDQSVFSVLIHKHNRHHFFDINKNERYGDWQTIVHFDNSYVHNFNKMVLSPRESKFGNFRFIS